MSCEASDSPSSLRIRRSLLPMIRMRIRNQVDTVTSLAVLTTLEHLDKFCMRISCEFPFHSSPRQESKNATKIHECYQGKPRGRRTIPPREKDASTSTKSTLDGGFYLSMGHHCRALCCSSSRLRDTPPKSSTKRRGSIL